MLVNEFVPDVPSSVKLVCACTSGEFITAKAAARNAVRWISFMA